MSHLETMKSLFHGLANKLNNVTTKAGSTPLMVGDYQTMSKEQLVHEMEKILKELQSIENNAMEAGRLCLQLKTEMYAALKDAGQ